MGELKGITINTDPAAEAHIYAEDDAAIYQSIVGSDGVMMIGQQCESQVISNNKVRVKDGVIVVGGHFARIPYGDYIDCEIVNGQSGRNRNDIIIAKFITKQIADTVAEQEKFGEAYAKAILEYLGIVYKEPSGNSGGSNSGSSGNLMRVQVGAFRDRKNAENLVEELKAKGYNAIIK